MAEINIYDAGDRIKLYATFTPGDPDVVKFELYNGNVEHSAYVATYEYGLDTEVTRLSEGVYVLIYEIPTAGYWRYKVIGTGAIMGVETWFFIARS